MILPITLTIAGAAAILHVWLSLRVSRLRRPLKIGVGDGGNEALLRRMRAHGNFAENMPIFLILLGLLELAGGDKTMAVGGRHRLHPRPHAPRFRHGPARRQAGCAWSASVVELAGPARPRRLGAELRLSPAGGVRNEIQIDQAAPRNCRGAAGLGRQFRARPDEAAQARASTRSATKGLVRRSWPKVLIGPWPGTKAVSSPKRPEPPGDRVDQILVVAHREVGAADRALEQHVADDGELRGGMVEDDMAGRVAGAVIDVEGQLRRPSTWSPLTSQRSDSKVLPVMP